MSLFEGRGRKKRIDFGLGSKSDQEFKIVINRCDICNDRLLSCPDNIEEKISSLDELNNSYESETDRIEPRLLLCSYCQKEYLLPSWLNYI